MKATLFVGLILLLLAIKRSPHVHEKLRLLVVKDALLA